MIRNIFTMLWWNSPDACTPEDRELVITCVGDLDRNKQLNYTYIICRYFADEDEYRTCDEYNDCVTVAAWASLTRDNYLIKKIEECSK